MILKRERDAIDYLLMAAIGLGVVLAIAAAFGAGVHTTVSGIRVSARTLLRPVAIVVAAALISASRSNRRERQLTHLWIATQRHATTLAVCLGIVVFAIAVRMSSFEANAS